SIPGDFCTVEVDGTLNLHGRGSVCINTAGQQVYTQYGAGTLELPPPARAARAGPQPQRSTVPGVRARESRRLQGAEAPGLRAERRPLAVRQGRLQGREGAGEAGARAARLPAGRIGSAPRGPGLSPTRRRALLR